MSIIKFKYSNGEYGFLSNFYPRVFKSENIKWKTSEHYYQYKKMKFLQSIGEPVTDEFLLAIILAKKPMDVKKLGHIRFNNIDKWDEIKVNQMLDVLRAKFSNEFFKERLINTGDAVLIEDAYYDNFWGNGKYGNGKNMLGKCLMQIRDEIINSQE
jgi:ribA/ribD-fused uncharacterized protein